MGEFLGCSPWVLRVVVVVVVVFHSNILLTLHLAPQEGQKKFSTLIVLDEEGAKSAFKKMKKKGGKKKGDVDVPRDMIADDSGEYVPVLAMECRGIEPYAFHPLGNEFKVTSSGGAVFEEDVDLSEGDWGDYDEENDEAVGVNEFESKIIAV